MFLNFGDRFFVLKTSRNDMKQEMSEGGGHNW